jgi:hypothetical protein
MSSNGATKLLDDDNHVQTGGGGSPACRGSSQVPAQVLVITDPNTVVDGRTIAQWAKTWLRTAFRSPVDENLFNDPQGTVAGEINQNDSPMYFITAGAPSETPRTFDVPFGKDILWPIASLEDTEGPNIPPTIPGFVPSQGSFADEVNLVLDTSAFTNVIVSVDGKPVRDLQETRTDIFSAGIVQDGSVGQVFFGPPGVPAGTKLYPTGLEGYWAVITGLSRGTHTLVSSSQYSSTYLPAPPTAPPVSIRTDIINVV